MLRDLSDQILFIDGEAIVIDKPHGLPVTAPRRGGVSVEAMLGILKIGFQRAPYIVHRLDQDTSGCLLLARNPKALKRFNAAFEAGLVTKHYIAILDGTPTAHEGVIDLPLAKVSSKEEGWRVVADPAGKPATTGWKVLRIERGRAMIELVPSTGRTHQLRVHAATGLGIPILGDPQYGQASGRMMLHASRLVIPRDGKPEIAVEAPLPEAFIQAGFA